MSLMLESLKWCFWQVVELCLLEVTRVNPQSFNKIGPTLTYALREPPGAKGDWGEYPGGDLDPLSVTNQSVVHVMPHA